MASPLHPEAKSSDVDANYSGTLREPLVKVIHSVSAVEYRDAHDEPIVFRQFPNVFGQFPRSSTFTFLSLSFSESEGGAMSEGARECACGLPPTATVDGLEIEAAGPLVLLENFPDLVRGSLWLHLVYGSSSVTQGDIQIDAKWSQVQRLRGSNGLPVWYKVKLCVGLSRGRLVNFCLSP